MSAMSASPVKPILPPTGVTSSPPKVAPPNTTAVSITPSIPPAACNISSSPLKNSGLNHNTVGLSLITENKVAPPPVSINVPSVQPLPRTPEKPKETVGVSVNNASPKVTSNGVTVTAAPTPVAQPASTPAPTTTPAVAPTSTAVAAAPAPVSNESPSNPLPAPKQESPAKSDPVSSLKPVENHAPEVTAAAPTPVAASVVSKSEPAAVKTTPSASSINKPAEKKLEVALPETKPEVKPETKPETKPVEKPAAVSAAASSTPTSAATPSSTVSPSNTATTAPATPAVPAVAVEKSPAKVTETAPKSEAKVVSVPRTPKRKAESKVAEAKGSSTDERKSKRARLPTQPYQSPLPELSLITKMTAPKPTPPKKEDDKLIVFYKNEFLAVRNAEGGFYVCQAMQNIYRSSSKIRIRWLSQNSNGVYIPDFYDNSDFECILTCLSMEKVDKDKWKLPDEERLRTENILKRALDVEKGVTEKPSVTEEHPDGLDLSLFKDEAQLKKSRKSAKKAAKKSKSPSPKKENESESKPEQSSKKKLATPAKKKKKATPGKKKTPKRTSGAGAKSQAPAKKPAETKKSAVKRKAAKTTSPSTSFSSLTPAEKRRKVIENLTKSVSNPNDRSAKTRSAGGAVAAKISSAALKMVITKDRDRRNVAAVRKK